MHGLEERVSGCGSIRHGRKAALVSVRALPFRAARASRSRDAFAPPSGINEMTDDDQKERDQRRAARAAAELKQTEDLLAGFDRPARTPRTPPAQDFVDFHLKKERSNPNLRAAAPDNAPASGPPSAQRRAEPTFVIGRDKRALPSWIAWTALVVVPAVLCVVAYFALRDRVSGPRATAPVPSAATTLSSANAPTSNAERDIPPPPPLPVPTPCADPAITGPSESTSDSPAPQTSRSSEGSGSNKPATSAPPKASAPRGDFIRNL